MYGLQWINILHAVTILSRLYNVVEMRLATAYDKELYDQLFSNYSTQLVPMKPGEGNKMVVRISLGLKNLIDLREKEQYMQTSGTLTLVWKGLIISFDFLHYIVSIYYISHAKRLRILTMLMRKLKLYILYKKFKC